jgi:hypothetical protein
MGSTLSPPTRPLANAFSPVLAFDTLTGAKAAADEARAARTRAYLAIVKEVGKLVLFEVGQARKAKRSRVLEFNIQKGPPISD